MSSLNRMLAVLSLFSTERPMWDADQISEALDCSKPTGYRYVRELVQAGLLQRLNEGMYSLGPRIALLDYVIRSSDPLLMASIPVMRDLVEKTDCQCVLSRMDGAYFLDLHREGPPQDLQLTYGRGRPRPLFRGGAPKVIMANLSSRRLQRLYEQHAEEIGNEGLGADWEGFRQYMLQIRRAGYYVSRGELEVGVCSISVPIKFSAQENPAALALVTSRTRFELMDHEKVLGMLQSAVMQITSGVQQIGSQG